MPLWGVMTWFIYEPRRVKCPEHGIGPRARGAGLRVGLIAQLGFVGLRLTCANEPFCTLRG